jgi:hypothetical protein
VCVYVSDIGGRACMYVCVCMEAYLVWTTAGLAAAAAHGLPPPPGACDGAGAGACLCMYVYV